MTTPGMKSVKAAAAWLACSPAAVREAIRLGRLPATVLNPAAKRPTYRIAESDLLQFVAENRRPVLPAAEIPLAIRRKARAAKLTRDYERIFPE